VAGVGFGLFQTTNRAAVAEMDVYRSTFVQLLVSAVILVAASAVTEDLGRVLHAPTGALVNFAAAGVVHFLVGWTLLNASQKRLGAARTSPLIATTPLFGAIVAAITLGEVPGALALLSIGLIVAGVYAIGLDRLRRPRSQEEVEPEPPESGRSPASFGHHGTTIVSTPGPHAVAGTEAFTWSAAPLGLGTALCWAISPIFIRHGLDGLPSPLLGVTVSMVAAVTAYGLLLLARRRPTMAPVPGRAWVWKLTAGMLVGVSTATRWYALSLVPVAVVLGLGLLSVPTVMALAPLVMGRQVERITVPVLMGAGLILTGALVLIVNA
jgi:drug/metabolite transporter (DMT)-like permease